MSGSILDPAVFRAYVQAGGWLLIPLFCVAFFIWYAYLSTVARLKEAMRGVDAHDLHLEARLGNGEDRRTFCDRLAGLPGAVPRMVRHVLLRLEAGLEFRDACRQCRGAEISGYACALTWLAALVAAAPLLGLLGTVFGMVETFDAVAGRSADAADLVAGGISQALITTQIGLVAALPGAFGLAHVIRLYRRLLNTLDRCESHLALVFEHGTPRARPIPSEEER